MRIAARTRGTTRALRAGAVVVSAAVVAAGLATVTATTAGAAFIVCAPGVNSFVWDGNAHDTAGHVGDNRNWGDAYNWDQDCIPGLLQEPHDDVVTIPAGANVFINDGGSADVAALTNNGKLNVVTGATLSTYGTSTSKNLLLQGTLSGTGRFTVTGTLTWQATPVSAATMETRRCEMVDCTMPAPVVGTTVIAAGAKLLINGLGVNLFDQRVIENHGTTTISGGGYIAADYGTAFRNLRAAGAVQPKLVFTSDGGYYQGFAIPGFGLSSFTNSGLVNKSGGTGVSVIDAAFSSTDPGSTFTGVQQVQSGELTIVTPGVSVVRTAKVKQGARFGNGGPAACDAHSDPGSCQAAEATPDDPEVATVELTKPGTTSSNVTIEEVSGVPPVTGQLGVPVRIETPNAKADATAPLRFRILLDAGLLGGVDPDVFVSTANVARQATTTGPYVNLPNCDMFGNPSAANPSCVARQLSTTETDALGNGDVVLVVSSLVNSRYRVSRTNG